MNAAVFRSVAIFSWSRNRWALIFLAAVFALLLLRSQLVDAEIETFSAIATILLLAPAFAPGAIFGTSGNVATADLLQPESAFPKHFFSLPATASQLVLPFMLYAVSLSAILWGLTIIISDGKLMAIGGDRSWLPFFTMSFVAWQLALSWTPVRNRITRLVQGVAPLAAYLVLLVYALAGTIPREILITLSLLQLPLAYAYGVRGLAMARRGEPGPRVESAGAGAPPRESAASRMPELTGPQQAIFWVERQMHRWVGKSAMIALLPVMLIMIIVFLRLRGSAENDPESLQTLGGITLMLLTLALVMIGISTGLNLASFRPRARSNEAEAFQITSFFAALPLRSDDFVWAKFKAGLANMLWVIGITLVVGVAVAQVSGLTVRWSAQYTAWTEQYGAAEAFLRVVIPLGVLLLFVLSLTVSVMWVGLRGRGWTIAFGIICFIAVVTMLAGLAVNRRHPGLIGDWMPEMLWTLAALKICGLALLIIRVQSRQLLSQGRLATILGVWAATVVGIVGFCTICLPDGAVAPLTAVCTGLVLAPVLGTVGAPLAMARNRVG
jgi:hypothetical protein